MMGAMVPKGLYEPSDPELYEAGDTTWNIYTDNTATGAFLLELRQWASTQLKWSFH